MLKDPAEQIEVWSPNVNGAVVRMPGRRFPGVVIQGDALSALLDSALSLVESLANKAGSEELDLAVELANQVESHLEHYEETLSAKGWSLPYVRDPERSARRFAESSEDAE
jgi:hypothetical protein